jgi:hypothetical protein
VVVSLVERSLWSVMIGRCMCVYILADVTILSLYYISDSIIHDIKYHVYTITILYVYVCPYQILIITAATMRLIPCTNLKQHTRERDRQWEIIQGKKDGI